MPVAFTCPCCGHQRTYTEAAIGRAVRCDACRAKIRIVNGGKFYVIDPPAAPATGETYGLEAPQTCKLCDTSFPAVPDETGRVKCPKCGTTFAPS